LIWRNIRLLTNLLIQKNYINGHIFFKTKLNIRVNWNNKLMNVHILVVCKNLINVMCVINVEKLMRFILNLKSHILINKVLYNFKMFSHILHHCGKLININTTWKAIIHKMSYGWCNGQTKPWNIYAIPTKGPIGITVNDNLSMNFYTYMKKNHKTNLPHQGFQIFEGHGI